MKKMFPIERLKTTRKQEAEQEESDLVGCFPGRPTPPWPSAIPHFPFPL